MDILRIATSGSVDDGKSTLIGRLLFESGQVPADRLAAIEESSKRRGLDFTDLSLLTDGLIAEREQGITIDVAHIYFATSKRKYIIADTPGHEEYTRNMVTGASQSDAAIVLVDARNGVVRQTRRHFYIASLLDLPHIIVAVNKMDLVNYDPSVFEKHTQELRGLAKRFGFNGHLHFVPVSALHGVGVTKLTEAVSWYDGPTLLELLENIETPQLTEGEVRFQVQQVIRPRSEGYEDYRGYAGVLSRGDLRLGQKLSVAPSGQEVTVKSIEKWGQTLEHSGPSKALTIHLEEDVDLPRGEWLSSQENSGSKQFQATLTWLGEQPLQVSGRYILQHGTTDAQCKIDLVDEIMDMDSLEPRTSGPVEMNDLARVSLRSNKALPLVPFEFRQQSGSFILIDPGTQDTVAVGLVRSVS